MNEKAMDWALKVLTTARDAVLAAYQDSQEAGRDAGGLWTATLGHIEDNGPHNDSLCPHCKAPDCPLAGIMCFVDQEVVDEAEGHVVDLFNAITAEHPDLVPSNFLVGVDDELLAEADHNDDIEQEMMEALIQGLKEMGITFGEDSDVSGFGIASRRGSDLLM